MIECRTWSLKYFNPGLPNIGGMLNEHRHILFLDKELCKVINISKKNSLYRGAKTLKDSLIHSKILSMITVLKIIEKVDVSEVGIDIESIRKKLKEREWHWQNN